MDCVEFERVLLEGENSAEQRAHLKSCAACANLQADFDLIASEAKLLLASHEPSPAVWNALEAQLRCEGLIREGRPTKPAFDFFRRWRTAWLVPVAAVLLVVAVTRLRHPSGIGENLPIAKQVPIKAPVTAVSADDQQLLSSVASRPPAQRARYRADLDDANAFIRDAEASVKSDPNDVFRQQMLINAYEQKQMLYNLAVDRVSDQ
jgi:hypothetical protein